MHISSGHLQTDSRSRSYFSWCPGNVMVLVHYYETEDNRHSQQGKNARDICKIFQLNCTSPWDANYNRRRKVQIFESSAVKKSVESVGLSTSFIFKHNKDSFNFPLAW